MSETELFKGFEQQYFELSNSIKTDLAAAKKQKQRTFAYFFLHYLAQRQDTLAKVKKSLDKAKGLMTQMKTEANSMAKAEIKKDLQKRVQTYTTDLTTQQQELKAAETGKNARDDLLGDEEQPQGGNASDLELASSEEYRQRMKNNTNTLRSGTGRLQQGIKILNETEETARETATNLAGQGKHIDDMVDDAKDLNGDLGESGRRITAINRQNMINKLLLVGVICVLIIVILVILFFILYPIINFLVQNFTPKDK